VVKVIFFTDTFLYKNLHYNINCHFDGKKLLARVLLGDFTARVALYSTTPVKLTPALSIFDVLMGVVAPAAAHQVATFST